MGTKSRETIYGASVWAAVERGGGFATQHARLAHQKQLIFGKAQFDAHG
jgi:hypothetical protein